MMDGLFIPMSLSVREGKGSNSHELAFRSFDTAQVEESRQGTYTNHV